MKSILFKSVTLLFAFVFTFETSFAQKNYSKISGVYKKNTEKTIMCGCNTQGLLKYNKEGKSSILTLCFDKEPGSFYEIFEGEKITVEGDLKGVKCANGKTYSVLYVEKSKLPVMKRKEVMPEFLKKAPAKKKSTGTEQKIISSPPTSATSKKVEMMEGSYVQSWSTKSNWSNFKDCKSCGSLNGNKNQPIIFDRIENKPEGWVNIRVWGTSEGQNFFVKRWELMTDKNSKSEPINTKKQAPKEKVWKDYKLSGVYKNNTENTIMCDCNTQGLLKYFSNEGKLIILTLCFDTEPGDFYKIYDDEKITVEGDVKNVQCANGENYNVLFVEKSYLPASQRQVVLPEALKNDKVEVMMEGSYMLAGSTKSDWSNYKHCTDCGVLNGNKSQPVVFDRLEKKPDMSKSPYVDLRVWGNSEGKSFYVTRWEYK